MISDGRGPQSMEVMVGEPVDSPEWPEVEWEDGYPLAEEDDFSAWTDIALDFRAAAAFLLTELPKVADHCCAWCEVSDAPDIFNRPVKRIEFSTGGWSGAESLIGLIERRADTRYFMESWRRGGHYVFDIPLTFLAPSEPEPGDIAPSPQIERRGVGL